jgi:hypothetical protein
MANWYCNNVRIYCQWKFFKCPELGYIDDMPAQVRADCSGYVSACLAKFGVYTYNPWGDTGHVQKSIDCTIVGRGDIEFNVSQNPPKGGHLSIPPLAGAAGYKGSSFIQSLMKKGGFVKMDGLSRSQWKAFDIIINTGHIEIFGGGSNTGSGGKAYTWGRAWDTVDKTKPWTRDQIKRAYGKLDPKNHSAPAGSSMAFESHMTYDTIYRFTGTPNSFPASSARS